MVDVMGKVSMLGILVEGEVVVVDSRLVDSRAGMKDMREGVVAVGMAKERSRAAEEGTIVASGRVTNRLGWLDIVGRLSSRLHLLLCLPLCHCGN